LSVGSWIAKHPGVLGNSIKVGLVTASVSNFSTIQYLTSSDATKYLYSSIFDSIPGTSEYASNLGKTSAADEVHVVVIDEDGAISGEVGTVLESFGYLSQASDAKKSDGSSNYYKDVINQQSAYVYWAAHDTNLTDAGETVSANTTFVTSTTALESSLSGGSDDNTPTTGEIALGFDLLEDSETEDVNLLFAAPDANGEEAIAEDLISIASSRKDCMAFVSPPIEDTVGSSTPAADVKAFADGLTSSSYASCDSTALYVYDKYNDVYRWIGAAGHQAGLCANTDNVADAWFSPAGVNRGQLLGVTKLAFNPKKADRDTLYKARVNPIVSLPGQGTILFGDKTLLSRPSSFDRINVRRLFITLEKAISTAAKAQLFEFNDEFTRAQFRNLVEPFLRDVKGRRGLTDFSVVCDTTNNTSQVIDTNKFVADIFVKPARSINFITLSFVATRSGVEFSEISGS